MNIRKQIWVNGRKPNLTLIIDYIYQNPTKFEVVMDLFFKGSLREIQRAAYIMSNVTQKKPHLIEPYLEKLVLNLETTDDDTTIRNTLRIFQSINTPVSVKGRLVSLCFNYLEDINNAIAIRAFSMTVLFNNVKDYPELVDELTLLIEENLVDGSPGIKSRGLKILKAIHTKKQPFTL